MIMLFIEPNRVMDPLFITFSCRSKNNWQLVGTLRITYFQMKENTQIQCKTFSVQRIPDIIRKIH